jgi:DNA-binding MarR family transcriptional regulator
MPYTDDLLFVSLSPDTRSADLSATERQLAMLVARAISQPSRLLSRVEVSLSGYAVFWSVVARDGRTQVEIATATGLSVKTVSRVVSQLGMGKEGLGLVRQMKDPDDGRVKRLVLSSKGKALRDRLLRDLRNTGQ